MLYATNMRRHANDKLRTADLDVHLLWMQTKHDASLDFWFWYKCFLIKMQNAISYDADVPCRSVSAKFIHDDASARIQTMMQMSPYRDGDANVF